MKKRILTAVIAIAGIFPFFWFSEPVGLTNLLNYLFPLLFSLISLVSVWELLNCLKLTGNLFVSLPLYVAAFAFPMLTRVLYQREELFIRIAILAALLIAIWLFGVIVFHFGKENMGKIALAFMTAFYIIGADSAVIFLRDQGKAGRFLFLIPFVFSWVTDSFAYFCGRLFGKHKLIPQVSPKKTVEGAVGGLVFCALTGFIYGLIVGRCFDVTPNYPVLAIGGIFIGVVSQIGDLIMSAIKREEGVKDFGWMLPGHGGLLDRFDSSMAVTLLVLLLNFCFPLFS